MSDIVMFMHCKKCFEELPKGESMQTFSRLAVGITEDNRVKVECVRHDLPVSYIDAHNMPNASCGHHDHTH